MNQSLFYYLNNLAGKSVCFDSIVIFCGEYLPYILVLAVALLLIFSKKDKILKLRFLIFSAISVFTARIVITEIIRYFYFHPRPFVVLNDINQLISHDPTGSFPSGHAVFFFALATAVYFLNKKASIIFFIGAILISISRVIAGIHWPLDILSGAAIGIIFSVFVAKFFKKL